LIDQLELKLESKKKIKYLVWSDHM